MNSKFDNMVSLTKVLSLRSPVSLPHTGIMERLSQLSSIDGGAERLSSGHSYASSTLFTEASP